MTSTCDICDKEGEGTHHDGSEEDQNPMGECFICDKCTEEECKKCGTSLEKGFCISCDGEEFPFGLSGHEISGA